MCQLVTLIQKMLSHLKLPLLNDLSTGVIHHNDSSFVLRLSFRCSLLPTLFISLPLGLPKTLEYAAPPPLLVLFFHGRRRRTCCRWGRRGWGRWGRRSGREGRGAWLFVKDYRVDRDGKWRSHCSIRSPKKMQKWKLSTKGLPMENFQF